jgi:hypothetical protein
MILLVFFKRRIGFKGVCVPRYFVPLTVKGALAIEIYKKIYPLLYVVLKSPRVKKSGETVLLLEKMVNYY